MADIAVTETSTGRAIIVPAYPKHRLIRSDDRRDLHNPSVAEAVAKAGLCGFVHLPTGRTCVLPSRHHGSCWFVAATEVLDGL